MFEKQQNEKNLAKREFNLWNQNKSERDQPELTGKKKAIEIKDTGEKGAAMKMGAQCKKCRIENDG